MTSVFSNWHQFGLMGCLVVIFTFTVNAATIDEKIQAIKSVGKNGQNHAAAMAASRELSKESANALPKILQSFQGANPLAINWLRGLVDTIADRAIKQPNGLSAEMLEKFVTDQTQSPIARRLAYEWLIKVDASASNRLIPGMIHDASPEFRRDAVERLIAKATAAQTAGNQSEEIEFLREALSGATDDDQVKAIVKPLRDRGQTVDLQKHFGFLTEWTLIGPFDNTGGKGFEAVYPPEKEIDLKAKYPGKSGDVEWTPLATEDEYGVFNIAKLTAPHKGSATYATTTFVADRPREVEIRIGTPNAWKLWVNGELVFAREEYHRGTFLDQYKMTTQLKSGTNRILLKSCQNEQTEDWAQDWTFQLRVCDHSGIAVLATPAVTTSSRK